MIVGVQTFTVRKAAKISLEKTLKQIRDLGIRYIELSRIKFNLQNAALVVDSKLQVTSLQVKPKELENHPKEIIAFCKTTGCPLVVASVLSLPAILGRKKAVIAFAKRLNDLAKIYNEVGIGLAFHHHDFEFVRTGGKLKFDYLLEETTSNVQFVIDTYWIKKAGRDPKTWIDKVGDRVAGLHLRDCSQRLLRNKVAKDCELGRGVIDFEEVLADVADRIAYGAIEQNTKTPFESLKISIHYLKTLNNQNLTF